VEFRDGSRVLSSGRWLRRSVAVFDRARQTRAPFIEVTTLDALRDRGGHRLLLAILSAAHFLVECSAPSEALTTCASLKRTNGYCHSLVIVDSEPGDQMFIRTVALLALLLLGMGQLTSVAHAATNVTSMGAIPNDGIDDTAAFQNAIDTTIPIGGTGAIYAPAGVYLLSSPLTIASRSVTIKGEGQRVTILKWTTTSDGIVYDASDPLYKVNKGLTIESVSLLTAGFGGTAIKAKWAESGFHGSLGFITANLLDVHIGPDVETTNYWQKGIHLTNVTAAKITRFNIVGRTENVYAATNGILVDGRSLGVRISQGDIWGVGIGIGAFGAADPLLVEGIDIANVDATDVDFGIVMANVVGPFISNCHTNSKIRGITLDGSSDGLVSGTLNYKKGGFAGWAGILLYASGAVRVANNLASSAGNVGASMGIGVSNGSNWNTINSNSSIGMDPYIWISSTSTNNIITGNLKIGPGVGVLNAGGTSNLEANNK
jgi:hypothetical protein